MFARDDGYTLLELLVAIAILALMSVPLATGASYGIERWEKGQKAASQAERDMLVRRRLQSWLEGSYLFDRYRHASASTPAIVGDEAYIAFSTVTYPDTSRNTLSRVILYLEEGVFIASLTPDFAIYGGDIEPTHVTLADGVEGLTVEYLDQWSTPNLPSWVNAWPVNPDHQDLAPAAIKLKLTFADNQRSWPELIVPLVLRDWSFCIANEQSKQCQAGQNAG